MRLDVHAASRALAVKRADCSSRRIGEPRIFRAFSMSSMREFASLGWLQVGEPKQWHPRRGRGPRPTLEQPQVADLLAPPPREPCCGRGMWPEDEWQGWWAWSEGRWYQWFYGKWWYWDYDQQKWIRWTEPAPATSRSAPVTEPRRSRSRSPPPPSGEPSAEGLEAVLVRGLKRVRLGD